MQPTSFGRAPSEHTFEVEQLLDNLTAIVIRFDATGHVTAWNHAAERALGLARASVLEQPLEALPLPWSDAAVTRKLLGAVSSDSQVRIDDVTYRRSDGTPGFLGLTATPLSTKDGSVSSVLVLGRDITEQRAQTRKQLQSQKLEAIGQLAAGIAHEINTPAQYLSDNLHFLRETFSEIAPLLQFACVGERSQPEAELARLAESIDGAYLLDEVPKAIEQALQGIQRISTIVMAMRAISPRGGEERGPADLNQAARDVAVLCSSEWSADAELRFALDEQLPKVVCKLSDVQQVLLNLLVNASHAIKQKRAGAQLPKGSIEIGSRAEPDAISLWIEDSGVGIEDAVRQRIFDPFFTTKPLGQGTGQGLSFAHAVVVDEHRGALEVESALGRGSRFTIRLPRVA
jgi:PAS domain S-box-containing protein